MNKLNIRLIYICVVITLSYCFTFSIDWQVERTKGSKSLKWIGASQDLRKRHTLRRNVQSDGPGVKSYIKTVCTQHCIQYMAGDDNCAPTVLTEPMRFTLLNQTFQCEPWNCNRTLVENRSKLKYQCNQTCHLVEPTSSLQLTCGPVLKCAQKNCDNFVDLFDPMDTQTMKMPNPYFI